MPTELYTKMAKLVNILCMLDCNSKLTEYGLGIQLG